MRGEIFVTTYVDGKVARCVGGLHLGARKLAKLGTPRRLGQRVAVAISLLTKAPAGPARITQQAVRAGDAFLLPAVAMHHNWNREQLTAALLKKAGARPGTDVSAYDCETWLYDGESERKMDGALPHHPRSNEPLATLARRLLKLGAGFLERMHVRRGPPNTSYHPFADLLRTSHVPVWLAHSAWTKACLGLRAEAKQDLARLRGRDLGELAFASLARTHLGLRAQADARRLWLSIGPHGGIEHPHQAFAPGQVLFALAHHGAGPVERALAYYRRFFRRERPLDAVCSLGQAFASWGRVLGDRQWSQMSLEIAEAVLPRQFASGAFGAHDAVTAASLEGVVAAWRAAKALREHARARRLLESIDAAVRFLETLVYQPRDAVVLPNPGWAMGGVRLSAYRSDVRVDFVQHLVQALRALPS